MNKPLFTRPHRALLASVVLACSMLLFTPGAMCQKRPASKSTRFRLPHKRVIYGLASFYSDRFNGRRTANGDIFSQRKLTCACNMLPFGTYIRVTNVTNDKSVIVKVNDKLHSRFGRRLVDLSKAAARKLGYTASGLVRVKVEVLGSKASR